MNDAFLVSGLKCFGDLPTDAQSLVGRYGVCRKSLMKGLTGNEFENEIVNPAGLLEPVNRGDVGMVQ
jgi:hypothetical protein